jgi:hypothetical protein
MKFRVIIPNTRDDYDTYYAETANGRREFWTYCEGRKAYVTKEFVDKSVRQGDKLVYVR